MHNAYLMIKQDIHCCFRGLYVWIKSIVGNESDPKNKADNERVVKKR